MLQQEAEVRRERAKKRKKNAEFKQKKEKRVWNRRPRNDLPYRYFELSAATPAALIDLLAKADDFVNLLLPP